MARRLGFIVCLIAMVAMLACATWADKNEECLEPGLLYTGDLFDKYGATGLCAQVTCDPCECRPKPTFLGGAGVWFQAWDLWHIRRTNGPLTTALTNAVGKVCDPQNFGSGVFEVQAFGAEGGPLEGAQSPPVAVTVFNCGPGIGIAAGGAILLDTCRPVPCIKNDLVDSQPAPNGNQAGGCIDYTCRRATFGLYYDVKKPEFDPRRLRENNLVQGLKPIEFCFDLPLPNGKTEQLLFLDPCNPDGAVKIKATNFRTATLPIFVHINIIPFWFYARFEGLKLTGYCEYTVGDGPTRTKYFEAMLGLNYWAFSKPPYFKCRDAAFRIRVWEYPNTTLYEAGGKIKDGGWRIF